MSIVATTLMMAAKVGRCFFQAQITSHTKRMLSSAGARQRSGKVFVNGVNLHFDDHGDESAHPVLCVPGALGSTMSDFRPQFEGLRDKCRVISFDLRGYGKSIPPKRDFPLDYFQRDANDLVAGMEALGIKKYTLLGWSDGGMASIILAAENPMKIHNLAIWGSNCYLTAEDIESIEKTRDTANWSERMRKPLEDVYGKDELQRIWSYYIEGYSNFLKLNNGDICSEYLKQIKCPVLVLHGEKDPLVPRFHADYIVKNTENAQLISFADGKHNIHLRYADEFNKIILNTLLKLE